MNNILIIVIITAAIIIAVAVLMRIRMSQQSSEPSLAVMPNVVTEQPSSQQSSEPSLAVMPCPPCPPCPPCNCSTTDQPSSQPSKEQFIIYSDVNFTGESIELPGPGAYHLRPECGPGLIIPFKPKSVKMPDRYRIGFLGHYGNPGDTHCGPSIKWVTEPSEFSNLHKGFGGDWVYINSNGSVIIEDKSIVRFTMDRYY
jgi:hypothetical protein